MSEIRVLPAHLVNKIAAGEVVERPASIVKELVENALDAGAANVDITVEDGGRKLIAVRDDGAGMGPDDIELAFAAHATSKLADEESLFHIATMGFRGEALASIAAVSHAQIVSRPKGSPPEAAHLLRAEGETLHGVRPASGPEGTTVTVRDLFFNTPARRKFMRTANTEFGHIVEQLARLALPHRDVAFSLTHNGRCTHRLEAAEGVRRRVGDLFGAEMAKSLIEFVDRDRNLEIVGLTGPPSAARASARWQYFFVNARYVRDRRLAHALREAYRGLIDQSRYPVAVIFLQVAPGEVDVNVHPTKIEVRFREGQFVHSQLLGALREALNKAELAPAADITRAPADLPPEEDDERRRSLKQALADFFKSQPPPQRRLDFPAGDEADAAPRPHALPGGTAAPPYRHARPAADWPGQTAEAPGPAAPQAWPEPAPPDAIQVHNSYIVTATDDGLAIIDQHALHERILYEELSRRLAGGNLDAQRLLIPETVDVAELEKAVLAEHADLLARLGIELTEFGPHSVAVHKFPSLLAGRKVPVGEFIRDLLDVLADDAPPGESEPILSRALSAMACKAAVKAGDPLTPEEIRSLLGRRREVPKGSSCPHGRPTALTLSLAELDKQFKRT